MKIHHKRLLDQEKIEKLLNAIHPSPPPIPQWQKIRTAADLMPVKNKVLLLLWLVGR